MKTNLRIALGADHGGFALKETLKQFLLNHHPELEVLDLGTYSTDSVNYPDFARKVCKRILSKESDLGILVCGTGIGISIQANRYPSIRAALVTNVEMAKMAKAHNNANILCLGGRIISDQDAIQCVEAWLSTPFEGGRHADRIAKLDEAL
jgi:ribose 5-phosphate isomerase B